MNNLTEYQAARLEDDRRYSKIAKALQELSRQHERGVLLHQDYVESVERVLHYKIK